MGKLSKHERRYSVDEDKDKDDEEGNARFLHLIRGRGKDNILQDVIHNSRESPSNDWSFNDPFQPFTENSTTHASTGGYFIVAQITVTVEKSFKLVGSTFSWHRYPPSATPNPSTRQR